MDSSAEKIANSHLMKFARKNGFMGDVNYQELHNWSLGDVGKFWSALWDYAGVIGDKGPPRLKMNLIWNMRGFPARQP